MKFVFLIFTLIAITVLHYNHLTTAWINVVQEFLFMLLWWNIFHYIQRNPVLVLQK